MRGCDGVINLFHLLSQMLHATYLFVDATYLGLFLGCMTVYLRREIKVCCTMGKHFLYAWMLWALFPLCLHAGGSCLSVIHLASERNIVRVDSMFNYLLLPVQDTAPEGMLSVVSGSNHAVSPVFRVRLARDRVDYYVPFPLSGYKACGCLSIDVQGVPSSSVCWASLQLSDSFAVAREEMFRPVYHHTPLYGWMNDPNGLFYKDGVWHLYFQHNPYGSTWGNMTWGHSISADLAHWAFQGDVLHPDAWGAVFSGSVVVDEKNTAGFGAGAVVAFYTSALPTPWGDVQAQSMAYSLDDGKTFVKFAHNPILTSGKRDFRDPKVFWYEPGKHWVMVLAGGQEMDIYSSMNLRDWKHESSFGIMQGAHGGVWECPDLFELPVEGSKEKKWVLVCNINPGGPFGGSATQYFVGSFDGKVFVNESPVGVKWMDYGKDHYAAVTFSHAPDGRTVLLAWMSNWQYQAALPTLQYRGANTIARDLSLYEADGDYFLRCVPAPEMREARTDTVQVAPFRVDGKRELLGLLKGNDGACEIELVMENKDASKISLTLCNQQGESTVLCCDIAHAQWTVDRSQSGMTGFSPDFPAVTAAPLADTLQICVRLFMDRSSLEVFCDGGKSVMTNRIFPSEPYDRLVFESLHGAFEVRSLAVHQLK